MQPDTVLPEITEAARTLAAQKTLRSKAVLIERLKPLIDAAMALGHKHEAIHEAITAGGVELTFPVYRNTLHRVRNRAGATVVQSPVTGSQEPKHGVGGSQEPKESGSQEPGSALPPPEPVSATGAFAVRDALTEAQQISNIDYRKAARSKRTT